MFRNPKGTFDVLPAPQSVGGAQVAGSAGWQWVEATIREVMARFNFEEIRTPIFEQMQLIARGIGQLTDIVSKEMFVFSRGKNDFVLRPELTAPVMRAFLQHNIAQQGGVQKLYYLGPCFRAERPQKGRFRQFHQFGAEVIGSEDARADAETMACLVAIYQAFGIVETKLRINSLGSPESRHTYKAALQDYFKPYAGQLSETSRHRLAHNPLRILDTKDENERKLLADAPLLVDFIDDEDRTHYAQAKALLDDLDIAYVEDPFLVRGLDYYTRTTYELEHAGIGAQSALAGGGRYDLLAVEIGNKKPVPAIGFAAGIERLFLALEAQGITLPQAPTPDVFMVTLGDAAQRWGFVQAQKLRKAGLRVALDLKGRSMKAQMREANRQKAPFTIIVGDNELEKDKVVIKNMASGEQQEVPAKDMETHLKNKAS